VKKEVSPLLIVAAAVVIIGIVIFAIWRSENGGPPPNDANMSAMPPQVSEEIKRRMSTAQPPAK
jgi:FtsZ-interacting cell division protein ZipA